MTQKSKIITGLVIAALAFGGYCFRIPIWTMIVHFYDLMTNRQAIQAYIVSWGMAAPIVFTAIQILQVVIAPIPGEATGFIGGFLFGTFKGFLYSSIGLSVGSLINFGIGRLLGNQFIRKMIPEGQIKKLDKLVHRQGAIVLFICFLFPGFPKDYLCLFLGISDIPFKLFFVMATFGRMPGTLALSVQGASLYDQEYVLMAVITVLCIVSAYLSYRYKENLYNWMDKLNGK
ncbi:MAG: TVP38/TMEM64 family protein [Deltaproteobacteria bacterium]|nr:TVP38/TMEM64 family protein [Deltaproteobacteria bacterium]